MPRPRRNRGGGGGGGGSSSANNTSSTSGGTDGTTPGGGSASDVANLSRTLGISVEEVKAMLEAQGAGIVPTATRSRTGGSSRGGRTGAPAGAAAASGGGAGNPWASFLAEGEGGGDGAKKSSEESGKKRSREEEEEKEAKAAAEEKKEETTTMTEAPVSLELSYELPIQPLLKLRDPPTSSTKDKKKKSSSSSSSSTTANKEGGGGGGGLLLQTGTLDSKMVGRSKLGSSDTLRPIDLYQPTLIAPSLFTKIPIGYIATSCSSCHSIAIDITGTNVYGWGRNEDGQLGFGGHCDTVYKPRKLESSNAFGSTTTKFIGGATGKGHTILVDDTGMAYAAGLNKLGQCGVNAKNSDHIVNFRKCVVVPHKKRDGEEDDDEEGGIGNSGRSSSRAKQKKKKKKSLAGDETKDEEGNDNDASTEVQIVQVSCGEAFSVLLDSQGRLYTCGSAEYGQLGNGDPGEHIIAANKIGFSNAAKFEPRSIYVTKDISKESANCSTPMDDKLVLQDTYQIRIGQISCGKNHAVAIEASPSPDRSTGKDAQPRRVFSWGCGNNGCLGHRIQADEWRPRYIDTFSGPMFTSNPPVSASSGSNCTMIRTKQGHVYYFGKHRNTAEAKMRPTILDALANNNHVVTTCSAGYQAVHCSTAIGNTVTWGQGPYGELGFGPDGAKSSAKPNFITTLDSCLVTQVCTGYGHALFLVRNEDDEDKEACKKFTSVEVDVLDEYDSFIDTKDGPPPTAGGPGKGKGKK